MAMGLMFTSSGRDAADREDRFRAIDRARVRGARESGRSLRLIWLLLGPGMLVMLGENDGPSMVSYATTGATYGVGFFAPFILLTFLMAYVVQEMTVRLGAATHRGHAELIFQRFGPFWGYFAMADLVFGNLLTLVTEFIAIQAGGLYFGAPAWLSVVLGGALVLASLALAALRDLGARVDGAGRLATCCSFPPRCLPIRTARRWRTRWRPGGRCLRRWAIAFLTLSSPMSGRRSRPG